MAADMAEDRGLRIVPGFLDAAEQTALVETLSAVIEAAPLYVPAMPKSGRPFSVRMTNCGPLGWVSDRDGYRYQPTHPGTGRPWPPIPAIALDAWRALGNYPHPPQACLVNYYRAGAKLGLHQDRDEEDFSAPVVSLSLGDAALFRIGGTSRKDPTRAVRLSSGDAVVLAGPARLAFHGIDRIYPGTSRVLGGLFPEGGRINLTLRRVTRPAE